MTVNATVIDESSPLARLRVAVAAKAASVDVDVRRFHQDLSSLRAKAVTEVPRGRLGRR